MTRRWNSHLVILFAAQAVMMAARSLIQLFRSVCPDLLLKKDRGRPTEASAELGSRKFGQIIAKDFVPGKQIFSQSPIEIYNALYFWV
jgi:hypothetical protein